MKKERNSVIASRKIEHGVVKVEDGLLAAFCCICSNTCCESWRVLPFKISLACAIAAW